MTEELINFYSEDRELPATLSVATKEWLLDIANQYGYEIAEINYIFCSDEYLLDINKTYLNHDYYTDIITFDNSEEDKTIESDIFISLDRVADNEQSLDVPRGTELIRVMAHGLLHLCGLKDKTDQEAQEMRKAEEIGISSWLNKFSK
jgi:probable rRNA maturation factor